MDLIITASISGLCQLAMHYFPWARVLKKELPRVAAYTLGVLAIMVPVSFLGSARALGLLDLWITVIVSGLCVFIAYLVDAALDGDDRAELLKSVLGTVHGE